MRDRVLIYIVRALITTSPRFKLLWNYQNFSRKLCNYRYHIWAISKISLKLVYGYQYLSIFINVSIDTQNFYKFKIPKYLSKPKSRTLQLLKACNSELKKKNKRTKKKSTRQTQRVGVDTAGMVFFFWSNGHCWFWCRLIRNPNSLYGCLSTVLSRL